MTEPKRRTVGRLDSAAGLRRELARLYKDGRTGEAAPSDVSKLASVLAVLHRVIETSALEERLARLEQAAEISRTEPWR